LDIGVALSFMRLAKYRLHSAPRRLFVPRIVAFAVVQIGSQAPAAIPSGILT